MADRKFRVVVAGAGLSGLFVAETLKRARIDFTSTPFGARASSSADCRIAIRGEAAQCDGLSRLAAFQRTWLCAARIEARASVGPCPRWRRLLLQPQMSYAMRHWLLLVIEGSGVACVAASASPPSLISLASADDDLIPRAAIPASRA